MVFFTMVVHLFYSVLASVFSFHYDHKFMVALALGIGLLLKEYIFDIHSMIINLLDKIGNILQSKVQDHNKILKQETVDKFKIRQASSEHFHRKPYDFRRGSGEFINLDQVNKDDIIDQIRKDTEKQS